MALVTLNSIPPTAFWYFRHATNKQANLLFAPRIQRATTFFSQTPPHGYADCRQLTVPSHHLGSQKRHQGPQRQIQGTFHSSPDLISHSECPDSSKSSMTSVFWFYAYLAILTVSRIIFRPILLYLLYLNGSVPDFFFCCRLSSPVNLYLGSLLRCRVSSNNCEWMSVEFISSEFWMHKNHCYLTSLSSLYAL